MSLAGEWLTATANTNMFTYEIAPVFILMENECLARMREIIGFQGRYSVPSCDFTAFTRDFLGVVSKHSLRFESAFKCSNC